jgi:hypothetical protein
MHIVLEGQSQSSGFADQLDFDHGWLPGDCLLSPRQGLDRRAISLIKPVLCRRRLFPNPGLQRRHLWALDRYALSTCWHGPAALALLSDVAVMTCGPDVGQGQLPSRRFTAC